MFSLFPGVFVVTEVVFENLGGLLSGETAILARFCAEKKLSGLSDDFLPVVDEDFSSASAALRTATAVDAVYPVLPVCFCRRADRCCW